MKECKHEIVLSSYYSDGGLVAKITGREFELIEYSREQDEEFVEDRTTINYCPMCGRKLGE